MMKISSPRTFSSIFTKVSPSGKGVMELLPSSIPMDLQIALARGSLAVPENTFTKSKQYWLLTVVMENPPDLADESFPYPNKRSIGCKPNLWPNLGLDCAHTSSFCHRRSTSSPELTRAVLWSKEFIK